MSLLNETAIVIFIPLFILGLYFLFKVKYLKNTTQINEELKFSIIIPARNEERNIGNLLKSIAFQNIRPFEIIVVDDDSDDATGQIALSFGAKVINPGPKPADWNGKPRACMIGAENASGDVFMFIDADVVFEKDGLAKIVNEFTTYKIADNYSVISISPYHKTKRIYEKLSSVFNIIMTGSMNAFTFSNNQPTGLYGPCLIVHKSQYYDIGGHSCVKNVILENLYMAEKFKEKGYNLNCLAGKNALSFRMYPDGFVDLYRGWSKAFASGANKTPVLSLISVISWISAGFLIFSVNLYNFIEIDYNLILPVLYIIYAFDFYIKSQKIGNFGIISSLLFPVHLIFYCLVFFNSLYIMSKGKSVNWKSRQAQIN